MAKSNAETIVNVIGIIAIVFGALGALGGLTVMLGASFLSSTMMGGFGGMFGAAVGAFVGLIMLIFGVIDIIAGVYVRRYNKTAKIFLLVVAILGILSFPFGTAWALFVGWAFLFNKEVMSLFR